jgi:riboflavin kinase/FMN adenylyltransferase
LGVRVYQSPFDRPKTESVVAIGSFDGLHLGHLALLEKLKALANENHLPSIVFTFDQPTRVLLEGSKFLYSLAEKLEILQNLGVSEVIAVPFTKEFSHRLPSAFLEDIRVLNPKEIVVGKDFRFGQARSGGIVDLETLATVHTLEMQTLNGTEVHASSIRIALENTDVTTANAMLGRSYHASDVVVRGQQLGRTIGTPTANCAVPEGKLLPKGVYAVRFETPNGVLHNAIANIGTRPTIGGMTESFEVHVFDFAQDIYGTEVSVYFEAFIRAEQKFNGLPALIAQLEQDKTTARALLNALDSHM